MQPDCFHVTDSSCDWLTDKWSSLTGWQLTALQLKWYWSLSITEDLRVYASCPLLPAPSFPAPAPTSPNWDWLTDKWSSLAGWQLTIAWLKWYWSLGITEAHRMYTSYSLFPAPTPCPLCSTTPTRPNWDWLTDKWSSLTGWQLTIARLKWYWSLSITEDHRMYASLNLNLIMPL